MKFYINLEDDKLTDKEKFKSFFDELNIRYDERQNIIFIEDHIEYEGRYGASLDLLFNEDGSFKMFSPWGE